MGSSIGIGIPLFWAVLDLEGQSRVKDRTALFNRVLEKLGLERIEAIIADREFIGKEWFQFLIKKKIPFVIRIKGCFMVEGIRRSYPVPVKTLCQQLVRKKKILNHCVVLWEYKLFISVQWKKHTKEPLIHIFFHTLYISFLKQKSNYSLGKRQGVFTKKI